MKSPSVSKLIAPLVAQAGLWFHVLREAKVLHVKMGSPQIILSAYDEDIFHIGFAQRIKHTLSESRG